jgi:hypothetical protein
MFAPDGPRDPEHWHLLSDADKEVYLQIRSALSAPSSRNKRNKRIDDFREVLDAIDIFLNTDEEDKWKRSLVCGMCRLSDGIAVNPTRLQRLVFKCKSSINGCLKGLGYDIVVANPCLSQELLREVPLLGSDPVEMRQWTLRKRTHPVRSEGWAEITPPLASEQEIGNGGVELSAFSQKGSGEVFRAGSPAECGDDPFCDGISDLLFDFL